MPGEPDARSEVVRVEIVRVFRNAIASGEGHHAGGIRHRIDGGRIERIHPVVEQFAARSIHIPTQPEIQREPGCDLPVVLKVGAIIDDAAADGQHFIDAGVLHPAELERRDSAAGGDVVKAEHASGGVPVEIVVLGTAALESKLHTMAALQPEQVLRQLRAHDRRLDALHVGALA